MFVDDGSMSQNAVDADMLQQYLTPGGVDGFLGVGMETDANNNAEEVVQDAGFFPIPNELLLTLPIAEVGPNTKIIRINRPTGNKDAPEPMPGPSGVVATQVEEDVMEEHDSVPAITEPPQREQVQINQQDDGRVVENNQVPKKGYNTKNRKKKTQSTVAEKQPEDPTLKDRMTLLGEITELMKTSYGARRNEMHVWGTYIGLKADRLPAGKARDKVLVKVEELMNEALYEGETVEE